MSIVTTGIDLPKNVFAVHGVDEVGKDRDKQASKSPSLPQSPASHFLFY
ncbi:hypothetical protein [Paraburkholderia kirstenboschensis]|nr:hypothetical protein [Paraburkholderia kirstenboschensis]